MQGFNNVYLNGGINNNLIPINSYRRCLSADMNYLTGLKERHYDAPMPSGFLTLKLNGPRKQPHYVIPVSTVCFLL